MSEIRVLAAAAATVPGVDSGDMFMLSISRNVIFTVSSHWIINRTHIQDIFQRAGNSELTSLGYDVAACLHLYIVSVSGEMPEVARMRGRSRAGGREDGGWRAGGGPIFRHSSGHSLSAPWPTIFFGQILSLSVSSHSILSTMYYDLCLCE